MKLTEMEKMKIADLGMTLAVELLGAAGVIGTLILLVGQYTPAAN